MAAMDGRVAIVTGGARGIGLAIARRFAADGAHVVIADLDERSGAEARETAAAAGRGSGGSASFVHCDVSERLDVRNLLASALDVSGRIDALVNNAGISQKADFLDLDEAGFEKVLKVNLKGAFLVGQAVARQMVETVAGGGRPGAIVNVSSINAVVALPDQVGYCVSKGGLAQLTRVMALALAPHGIRVNAVGPGSVMTDMLRGVLDDPAAMRTALSRTPLGRAARPEEIAGVVAFLVSDDASYLTGETVYADGGRLGLNLTVPPRD